MFCAAFYFMPFVETYEASVCIVTHRLFPYSKAWNCIQPFDVLRLATSDLLG
jgi:hypothetical protein